MTLTMTDLIAKLEAADGPARELDYEIAAAIGWPDAPHSKQHARRYTESVDAALTLYKEKPNRVPSNPIDACIEGLKQWT